MTGRKEWISFLKGEVYTGNSQQVISHELGLKHTLMIDHIV